jgi:hypothetical protein
LSTSNGFLLSFVLKHNIKQTKKKHYNEYTKNCNSKSGRLNEDSIQILIADFTNNGIDQLKAEASNFP